jgi:hypothetical protein
MLSEQSSISSVAPRREAALPYSGRAAALQSLTNIATQLAEGIDPQRFTAIAGRTLDPKRVSILQGEGVVETTADGRLRVTQSGFPVLDAVVADLAA